MICRDKEEEGLHTKRQHTQRKMENGTGHVAFAWCGRDSHPINRPCLVWHGLSFSIYFLMINDFVYLSKNRHFKNFTKKVTKNFKIYPPWHIYHNFFCDTINHKLIPVWYIYFNLYQCDAFTLNFFLRHKKPKLISAWGKYVTWAKIWSFKNNLR